MNSSGLGVSPKWCQMDCAGPMETLTNLFKAQKGMLGFLGHQGKAGRKGLVMCVGEGAGERAGLVLCAHCLLLCAICHCSNLVFFV